MKIKAAICWEPRQRLEIEEVDLEGPKSGEVLVRLEATGVCHTDAYTMSGKDPEGLFPAILGELKRCSFIYFARWVIIDKPPYFGPPQPKEKMSSSTWSFCLKRFHC